MTKIIQAKYKISRRLGVNLWGRAKDPFLKRNYSPGQHGPTLLNRKVSDYGKQLQAKQRLKGCYGRITEKQFRLAYKEASRMKGDTGENMVALLERRLDSVVYRLNLASTVFGARQLVSHKHIRVNGKMVNIPSYLVKEGDVIEVANGAKQMASILTAVQVMERPIPSYMSFEPQALKGTFVRIPTLSEVPYAVQMEPHLVVEFYSR